MSFLLYCILLYMQRRKMSGVDDSIQISFHKSYTTVFLFLSLFLLLLQFIFLLAYECFNFSYCLFCFIIIILFYFISFCFTFFFCYTVHFSFVFANQAILIYETFKYIHAVFIKCRTFC